MKRPVFEKIPGTVSIGRPSNSENDDVATVRMYFKVDGKRVTYEMTAENFALAITGRSEVPIFLEQKVAQETEKAAASAPIAFSAPDIDEDGNEGMPTRSHRLD